jgi:hypothetical protein
MALKDELLAASSATTAMMPYWTMVEAIIAGLDAMREGGTDFLPKFPAEEDDDYTYRLSLTKFTNIYRDVLEGLATKPFEEEITLIGKSGRPIPTELIDFVENVDGGGNNISQFASQVFFNGINNAIDWIFIDMPVVDTDKSISIADAKALKLRPFWTRVLAKNVLEVRTENHGAENVITYIRILEPAVDNNPVRVRVFKKTDSLVEWELWEIPATGPSSDEIVMVGSGTLSIGIIPFVPFITGRKDGNTFKFAPPMRDAADLQITLYQNESALEFIKALAAYPMLAANGMKPEKDANGKIKKVAIGPGRVLYGVPDGNGGNGEWKFIEPTSNSMEFLLKSCDKTKQDLRELGRQPLTALSTQLTTVTTSIAAGKARSAVTAWALGLKDTLENALVITNLFMKITSYDPEVNVYTGFDNVKDDGSDLETLNKARENNDLSLDTYWFELKRRKVLSPEFTAENERKKLLEEIPTDGIDDAEGEESPDTSTPLIKPDLDNDGA